MLETFADGIYYDDFFLSPNYTPSGPGYVDESGALRPGVNIFGFRELARRTRLVGIFPSTQSLMRYIAALLLEIDDDWQVEERRYLSQESMARLYAKRPSLDAPAA